MPLTLLELGVEAGKVAMSSLEDETPTGVRTADGAVSLHWAPWVFRMLGPSPQHRIRSHLVVDPNC